MLCAARAADHLLEVVEAAASEIVHKDCAARMFLGGVPFSITSYVVAAGNATFLKRAGSITHCYPSDLPAVSTSAIGSLATDDGEVSS